MLSSHFIVTEEKAVEVFTAFRYVIIKVQTAGVIINTHIWEEAVETKVKGKGLYSAYWQTPLTCSGMACIIKGSHDFTCTPHVHPLMK